MAEFKLIGLVRRRPPLVNVMFDASFHNSSSDDRWLLVPDRLNSRFLSAPGGIEGLEVFELTGPDRAIIGHFLGTQGFVSMLLRAGATLSVRRFTLQLWADSPSRELLIDVVLARKISLAAEDALTWFNMNPAIATRAEVTTEGGRLLHSKHTPDYREVELAADIDHRMTIHIPLDQPLL